MQGSNGTKFQSIIGSLGRSSSTSPGKLFIPFPVLLPKQQSKMCSSSPCFFTQQESKLSCLIRPQSYCVHSLFCRDLPCEFMRPSWALRLPGTVPRRGARLCYGEAVAMVVPHGWCCSHPCAPWYRLRYLCATDTARVRMMFPRTRHNSTGEQTDDLTLCTTASYP